jgi:ligand-binding SRPBCC domain-containing protein
MKIYKLERTQIIKASLDEAWTFFSSPVNLVEITPADMNFSITSPIDSNIYEGQIIRYKVRVLPGYTTEWVSKISGVNEPHAFVDEQVKGPYALWRHLHQFEKTLDGTLVIDHVQYAVPFGVLGKLANQYLVQPKLNTIFNYRSEAIKKNLG